MSTTHPKDTVSKATEKKNATKSPPRFGLVLPAGGAKAAFQVGVLKYISKHFPSYQPTVFSGVSAGSINASSLAQGEPFQPSVEKLYNVWQNINFEKVLSTNFSTFLRMGTRWAYDMVASKITKKISIKSLLDASPLAQTLLENINFHRISQAIVSGKVHGLAVTATNYHTGESTAFFESHENIPNWVREQRVSEKTVIRVRHIMASCSIPILFEPVKIGKFYYGDGSLRFNFPMSPAINLGATHIIAIGIKTATRPNIPQAATNHNVTLGFIGGVILNSIFLDSIEIDYENICRINRSVQAYRDSSQVIQTLLIRPSQDLGLFAKYYMDEIPFHYRKLLTTASNPEEASDFLSYLMFTPGYIRALLTLGEQDAKNHHDEIEEHIMNLNALKKSQEIT